MIRVVIVALALGLLAAYCVHPSDAEVSVPAAKPWHVHAIPPDDDIERLNRRINRQITYTPSASFAPNERWGDCKDYASVKREHLIRAGTDPARLHIWLTRDEANEGHAVLMVDGWRVLDNRFPHSIAKDALEYSGYVFLRPCPACDRAADTNDTTQAAFITAPD